MNIVPQRIAYKLHDYGWYPGMSKEEFYTKIQPTTLEAWNWAIGNSILNIQIIRAIPNDEGEYYNHIVLDNGKCFDVPFGEMTSSEAMEAALFYVFDNDLVNNRIAYF